jgi:hypothetical protein
LKAATNGFSSDYIVSESGEKAPNFVYKGRLDQSRWIAVKRFPKAAWPDAKGFAVMGLSCRVFHLLLAFRDLEAKQCGHASVDFIPFGTCIWEVLLSSIFDFV